MAEILTFGPFTEAQGEVSAFLGENIYRRWHEITVSIFDAVGDPAASATGTLTGKVRKTGADQTEDFTATLDLAGGERAWQPELSSANTFFFEVTGLNAGYTYLITTNSWKY